MRYRLRTLLILLTVGPPMLARAWWTRGATLDAVHRASPEVWIQLLGLAVASAVVAADSAAALKARFRDPPCSARRFHDPRAGAADRDRGGGGLVVDWPRSAWRSTASCCKRRIRSDSEREGSRHALFVQSANRTDVAACYSDGEWMNFSKFPDLQRRDPSSYNDLSLPMFRLHDQRGVLWLTWGGFTPLQ